MALTLCLTPALSAGQATPDTTKTGESPAAQTQEKATGQTSSTSQQPVTPAIALPPKGTYKHGFKITTAYDKFEDRTVTVLENLWDHKAGFTNQSHYRLTATFWYPGNGQPPSVDSIKVRLQINADVEIGKEAMSGAVAQQSKFAEPEQRKLVFLVDGATRVDVGAGEHEANLSKRSFGNQILGSDRWVKEVIVYDVALADWAKIANAKSLIEGRFGKESFKLEKKDLEAVRDFTSRMAP